MGIQIRRSPGTARQIGEMLAKVNAVVGDVELVTIGRRAPIGYADTGLSLDVDQTDSHVRAEDLVSEVVSACREHSIEQGDAWYQATFLSAEREVSAGRGKNKVAAKARTTLASCAFPIGEAADGDSNPRTAAKAQIESEAAVAIRTISTWSEATLTRLGEKVVDIAGAVAALTVAQVEVVKQVAQQQKTYVTQGETLVELVRMNHAHSLAMAEAEASERHADQVIAFGKEFGMAWAKANLFGAGAKKAGFSEGFKPDPNKPDAVNILADVMHGVTEEKKAKLIELVGQDVFDLWLGASKVDTLDEFKAIMVRMRELWAGADMQKIGTGLAAILGPEVVAKLYAAFVEADIMEM